VYSFRYNAVNLTWDLYQDITSPVGKGDRFGISVSIGEYRLGVGADEYRKFLFSYFRHILLTILPFAASGNATGTAFVYSRIEQIAFWEPHVYFPSPVGGDGRFGNSLDVSDDFALIGSYSYGECYLSVSD
jgi:hypothetical protein